MWLGAIDEFEAGASRELVGGLVAIPIEPAGFADFARTKLVRDLTESECQEFLGSACADHPSTRR